MRRPLEGECEEVIRAGCEEVIRGGYEEAPMTSSHTPSNEFTLPSFDIPTPSL